MKWIKEAICFIFKPVLWLLKNTGVLVLYVASMSIYAILNKKGTQEAENDTAAFLVGTLFWGMIIIRFFFLQS